jgi:hypothetical protein
MSISHLIIDDRREIPAARTFPGAVIAVFETAT